MCIKTNDNSFDTKSHGNLLENISYQWLLAPFYFSAHTHVEKFPKSLYQFVTTVSVTGQPVL